MVSDLQHLQRYASTGDAHAFRELVRAHGAMVHATALRVTRNEASAHDVAQEAFLELARKAGGITQSVGAWLHRVAWNRACDVVRRECSRRQAEEAMAETWHTDREATWAELEPHLDEALNELPQDQREALVLDFLESRTQAEVARHLGKNQSSVSRCIERGVSAIREALKARGVICGAGLATLVSAHSAQAMPATLTASLGKLSVSGVGVPATVTPPSSTLFTTTLLTMTTTTKVLIGTAAVAAMGFFLAPKPVPRKPLVQATDRTTKPTQEKAAENPPERKHYRPPPASAEVRRKADALIRRIRLLSKAEQQKDPELQSIQKRFFELVSRPETQRKIIERAETAVAVSGVEHGTLQIGDGSVDSAFGRAIIEVTLAGDAQLAEDVVLNRLDGAIFEFGLEPGARESSDGVIITPINKPGKPATETDSRQAAPRGEN